MAQDKPRISYDRKPNDATRPVFEKPQNREDRLRSTDTKSTKWNVLPKDGRGVRDTKTAGRQFQQPATPDRGK